jgi:hypothetical protein
MKAQKYLGVEESHNVEHKNEGRKVEEWACKMIKIYFEYTVKSKKWNEMKCKQ